MTHLYRHFNGGRLETNINPVARPELNYLGYVSAHEYDGVKYYSFTAAYMMPQHIAPTRVELWKYGCE